MKRFLIVVCFLIHLPFCQAQTITSALKAMGAPNNPEVDIAWNRYYDYAEIQDICRQLAKAHPQLVQMSFIGRSVQGRELTLLTVTNAETGPDTQKPAMYVDGNIHANEIQGSEVALYTAWYLAENYGEIEWITDLVDTRTFYIVPSINPDARDYYIHEPNSPHSPRTGLLPRDDDGDGRYDEDPPDDLDGDGNIVMMRKADANGRWTTDPEDPRRMVRAEPDEKGEYTLIGWEGLDNDADGNVNEDGPGYYDPNRNWGIDWQPESVQNGADQYPFSIPEKPGGG
ncbi:MAG: M14 family metallopeptidase [candidate division KSB1 bacterium]|nr:M14 family metallopeptidase [candidate division KSB1 bacterium]